MCQCSSPGFWFTVLIVLCAREVEDFGGKPVAVSLMHIFSVQSASEQVDGEQAVGVFSPASGGSHRIAALQESDVVCCGNQHELA